VRFIDERLSGLARNGAVKVWRTRGAAACVAGLAAVLTGCGVPPPAPAPTQAPTPQRAPSPPAAAPAGRPTLAPPTGQLRSWREYQVRAAQRLVAAHPDSSYTGKVQEPLLAVPVLEVELRADGSVAKVDVLRYPKQARDAAQLAIDAVHRAAPYGDVSKLPKPWKFTETFLFNDDRHFKPRTLDD